MNQFFRAVRRGTFGGQKAGLLQQWIESYVRTLFPEAGIEWWSCNDYGGPKDLKKDSPLPVAGVKPEDIHHFACYVRDGNESPMIEVSFILKNGDMLNLTTAKIFDNRTTCWQIAHAIERALHSIFAYEEIPEIVDLAAKLPRKASWSHETDITEPVHIDKSASTFTVRTGSGRVIDQRDFHETGEGAIYRVEAYVEDWKTVLTNMCATVAPSSTPAVGPIPV
ncbi:hypothetical protein [Paraburkholderia fungorum]|jgi:hypothetical protein|uniref:Uncharacterized protein n=1 Tax=Paraburkholderia fungorum TaxID=134537 RepID=A0AAW3V464_9BURK|nr:hypothetical protein [Paraburkholderia fungorum]AJZ56184.1 hypothetical protein OI25_8104 [Paraburkholderia fungorum]MBB4516407.1 hypothetical protein [Paraburkholderia fungorum]MBB5545336.1 hypothetical protein [Paraburkholderia fungorum]MBB6205121.1 hypothetical protein [Paraburkholderia fungorum]MBU7440724.1 hypothetical protein [Paraburkholderia fungorum]